MRLVADAELERALEHVDELDLARQRVELVAGAGARRDLRLDHLEPLLVARGEQVVLGREERVDRRALVAAHERGAGSRSKMWLSRTPSASQMRAIEDSDGEVRSRSSWLMKPLVSPVAAATCSIVSPRSRRSERTRAPTLGVSFRPRGERREAASIIRRKAALTGALAVTELAAILFVACTRTLIRREELTE